MKRGIYIAIQLLPAVFDAITTATRRRWSATKFNPGPAIDAIAFIGTGVTFIIIGIVLLLVATKPPPR